MKRLSTISIVFILAIEAVVFGYVTTTNAAPPPTTTPQNPPDTIACFVGDVLFVLPKWTPSTTPTRIPTPTPLSEASPTRMVTLMPQPTGTPAFLVRIVVNAVNVRSGAGTQFPIVGGLAKGANVNLSTAPADTVTVNLNGAVSVWMRLAGEGQKWISISAAGIVK